MKKTFFYTLIATFLLACDKDSSMDSTGIVGSGNETGGVGKGGSMARFTVSGNTLFTVSFQSLKAFDISSPQKPVYMSESWIGTDIETIFPKGNHLFIGAQSGMYIYDVTDPNKPVQLSKYIHVVSCDPVVAHDNYAYVTLRASGANCFRGENVLRILDISDPRTPSLVKAYPMTSPRGLGIDANLNLFVCDNGLKHYDATDVMSLQLIDHFTGISPFDVIPIGNRLLLIGEDGFYQYLLDNGSLTLLSKIPVG